MSRLKKTYQIINDPKHNLYQIRSKSDLMIVEFHDPVEREIFSILSEKLNEGQEVEKIVKAHLKRFPKEKIEEVLHELGQYNILEESEKSLFNSDKFHSEQTLFWNSWSGYQTDSTDSRQQLIEACKLLIIGTENRLRILKEKAKSSGFSNIKSIDSSTDQLSEKELNKLFRSIDVAIVDCDEWNPNFLDTINKTAMEEEKPWMILRGNSAMKTSVGPLFIPKETGCYNCLMSRIKSHIEYLPYFEEFERHLREKNGSARSEGGLMAMYEIVANLAMMELIKYVTHWAPTELYNSYINIDFRTYDFNKYHFLKVPNCSACKPEIDFTPAPWLEPITLK